MTWNGVNFLEQIKTDLIMQGRKPIVSRKEFNAYLYRYANIVTEKTQHKTLRNMSMAGLIELKDNKIHILI